MNVKFINGKGDGTIEADSVYLNYQEGFITFVYNDDNKARDFEARVRNLGGKTKHVDKSFTLTNLSDFTYVFE